MMLSLANSPSVKSPVTSLDIKTYTISIVNQLGGRGGGTPHLKEVKC